MDIFNGYANEIEDTKRKVTEIDSTADDIKYPSAKAVKDYVDSVAGSVFHFKGVAEEFPITAQNGDAWQINGTMYSWNGSEWVELPSTFDLSLYSTTAEMNSAIESAIESAMQNVDYIIESHDIGENPETATTDYEYWHWDIYKSGKIKIYTKGRITDTQGATSQSGSLYFNSNLVSIPLPNTVPEIVPNTFGMINCYVKASGRRGIVSPDYFYQENAKGMNIRYFLPTQVSSAITYIYRIDFEGVLA